MIGKLLLPLCVSCLAFMPLKNHSAGAAGKLIEATKAGITQFLATYENRQEPKPSGKASVQQPSTNPKEQSMELGTFSISTCEPDGGTDSDHCRCNVERRGGNDEIVPDGALPLLPQPPT